MEANFENPSQMNRLCVDRLHKTDTIEWKKKRKLQSDQLDLHRPKHKCWIENSSSEHDFTSGENPVSEGVHIYVVKGRTDAELLDACSGPESGKDSNSFIEDSSTSISVDEGGKHEVDSAKPYLRGRPSTSYDNWDGHDVKDSHCSLDVSAAEKVCSGEDETFVDKEYNPSYHFADFNALKSLEDHFLGLGNDADHIYSGYANDNIEESVDKEFEDILYSKGENPATFVLSSGRWNVNQEVQSNTRPPTIDQEFEDYFSMLML